MWNVTPTQLSAEQSSVSVYVYRMLDASGRLLYVGVSDNLGRRLHQHSRDKAWWPEVATIRVGSFASRAEAEEVESVAITCEAPAHNGAHTAHVKQGVRAPDAIMAGARVRRIEHRSAEELRHGTATVLELVDIRGIPGVLVCADRRRGRRAWSVKNTRLALEQPEGVSTIWSPRPLVEFELQSSDIATLWPPTPIVKTKKSAPASVASVTDTPEMLKLLAEWDQADPIPHQRQIQALSDRRALATDALRAHLTQAGQGRGAVALIHGYVRRADGTINQQRISQILAKAAAVRADVAWLSAALVGGCLSEADHAAEARHLVCALDAPYGPNPDNLPGWTRGEGRDWVAPSGTTYTPFDRNPARPGLVEVDVRIVVVDTWDVCYRVPAVTAG